MNYLAIDTSGEHLTVLVSFNGKYYSEYLSNCNLKHSLTLMPTVEKVMNESGAKLEDMDFFSAVVGPGSFTGIRIGVATVKALCYANSKKILGVTSFDVLAYNKPKGKYLTVIDANHDNFYVCAYDNLKVIMQPKFVNLEQLEELKKDYDGILTQNGISVESETVDMLKGLKLAVEGLKDNACEDREILVPLYVKKSQAEESL